MTSLAKLSSKFQGNTLWISWLSHFGHEETLGMSGSKKQQPPLTLQEQKSLGGGSRKLSLCHITNGPMLRFLCRLACPKTKLHPSLTMACCPILCSTLLSREATQSSQANLPVGHPPALCMALSLFPGTKLVEIVICKWGLKSRYVETDLPAVTCSCVYMKINKEAY